MGMPELKVSISAGLRARAEMHNQGNGEDPSELMVPALEEYLESSKDSIFQVSTSVALVEGVSGPSATADTEMIRSQGVHGPRFLTVFLLSETSITVPILSEI